MATIVLDMGSGTTCNNHYDTVDKMVVAAAGVDTGKHEVVFKWQLFRQSTVPYVHALRPEVFSFAYETALELGYGTTASVFDPWSLDFLRRFDVPFIKIACRAWCYPLIGMIGRGETVYVSVDSGKWAERWETLWGVTPMCCVPDYPANPTVYKTMFGDRLSVAISDHCADMALYHEYHPLVYERHFKLPGSTGPDAGAHASTPEDLEAIL